MIRYLEEKRLLALETRHASYWIALADVGPVHLYWGRPIDAQDAEAFAAPRDHSSFDMQIWRERLEYPAWDGRTFLSAALKADRPLSLETQAVEVEGERAVIRLRDEQTGLEVLLHYQVYPDLDVIEKRAQLRLGGRAMTFTRIDSGACCLPGDSNWVAHYTVGAWTSEFQRRTASLAEGELRLQSTRGMSGPHMNPSLLIAQSGEEEQGLAYCAALGWSGCWQIGVSSSVFGNRRLTAGLNDADLRLSLAAGEGFTTAPVYLCMSDEGLGGLSRRMHDFERQVLAADRRPRRVLYNSWEATLFDVKVEEQKTLAERAAQMGVELFVVDDGWFGQRHSDRAGLGDWYVNPEKFPNGLGELIDHVRGLGMDFGIWVEPEAVNPDSDLFRAHPDWIHRLPGMEPMQQRNQYMLNLGLPQVEAFALDMLRELLTRYEISYLKWDMNRSMTDVCEQLTPFAREKHVLAVYRILEALRREFPAVDVEACSGGGARVDLGMIARTAQFWPSDNTDPFERLLIQEGASLVYSPAFTSCWVTDTPASAHRSGRNDLRYKFHVAMCGSLGVGANIARFTDGEIALCAEEIARYKALRHLVQEGDLYRLLSPSRSELAAVEYCAKDGSEAVMLCFLHSQRYGCAMPRIPLRGLRVDARYLCEETGRTYSGSTLMHLGLQPDLRGDFDSQVIHLKAV